MTRLQMKGIATLIFIPIFILFTGIGLAFCSTDANAQELPQAFKRFQQMSPEQIMAAKAEATKRLTDPEYARMMAAVTLGAQAAALNERYGDRASDIISKYIGEDSEAWGELEDLRHETEALRNDLDHMVLDMLLYGGNNVELGQDAQIRTYKEATEMLNDAYAEFIAAIQLMRMVAEEVYRESMAPLTPDLDTLIIPELEPDR